MDLLLRRAARLIVFDSSRRLLLFQYEDHRGPWWATPGGGLDNHEDFEQAAVREAREELGASQVELVPLWKRTTEYEARGRLVRQFEQFFLVTKGCEPDAIQGQTSEHKLEGIRAARWWSLEDLRRTTELVFPEDLYARLHEQGVAATELVARLQARSGVR